MTPLMRAELTGPGVRSSRRLTTAAPPGQRVPTASVQGTLALDLSPRPSPHLRRRPDLRLVEDEQRELDAVVSRFVHALVEVVAGVRGVQQLRRSTTDEVFADLCARVAVLHRAAGEQRGRRLNAQVRSLHVFSPTPTAAEVSVHVRHGQRSRAIAVRLELGERGWRCVAVQFG